MHMIKVPMPKVKVAIRSEVKIIPAKFHDFSVMLTNLKASHDLTIVF